MSGSGGLAAGAGLRPGTPLAGQGRGRTAVLLGVAGAAMVALLLWWLLPTGQELADRALVGPRGPACLRLVMAVDQSGSMRDETDARDAAFAELVPWAARNLRPDDELDVIDFAAEARLRAATPVSRLATTTVPGPAPVRDGRYTLLDPVLDQVRSLGASSCDTALVLLSDGQLVGVPSSEDAARLLLRGAGLHDLLLLVPGRSLEVPPEWSTFPTAAVRRFDGTDADVTAEAFGSAIGSLTGQTLTN